MTEEAKALSRWYDDPHFRVYVYGGWDDVKTYRAQGAVTKYVKALYGHPDFDEYEKCIVELWNGIPNRGGELVFQIPALAWMQFVARS